MLGLVPKHPQVGVGDAVTLPSMQKAARDLSSRRVPLVRVPLVLGSVAFWCRAGRVREGGLSADPNPNPNRS